MCIICPGDLLCSHSIVHSDFLPIVHGLTTPECSGTDKESLKYAYSNPAMPACATSTAKMEFLKADPDLCDRHSKGDICGKYVLLPKAANSREDAYFIVFRQDQTHGYVCAPQQATVNGKTTIIKDIVGAILKIPLNILREKVVEIPSIVNENSQTNQTSLLHVNYIGWCMEAGLSGIGWWERHFGPLLDESGQGEFAVVRNTTRLARANRRSSARQ